MSNEKRNNVIVSMDFNPLVNFICTNYRVSKKTALKVLKRTVEEIKLEKTTSYNAFYALPFELEDVKKVASL